MNKLFSFLAGSICGALVGAVTALLLAPASGQQLRSDAGARWNLAMQEAQRAMAARQQELDAQFEEMKKGN
jgi:gas vesicle protein